MNNIKKITDNSKTHFFFWQTTSPFSNWHPADYTLNNINFNCSEQGVMYDKAILFGDNNVAQKILNCNQSQQKLMKNLGREVSGFNETTWRKNRVEIYKKHCKAKFSQNLHLKQALLNTTGKILVEASPNDRIWGIGMHKNEALVTPPNEWKGLNLLGKILTEIRNEFEQNII
jgi:ribA/ribD-fused uncharacterized protein